MAVMAASGVRRNNAVCFTTFQCRWMAVPSSSIRLPVMPGTRHRCGADDGIASERTIRRRRYAGFNGFHLPVD
jgi:hypothetical protein